MHCFRLPFDLSASARSGGHCRRRGEWEGGALDDAHDVTVLYLG